MLHKLASTTDIMVQTHIVPYDEVKTPRATRRLFTPGQSQIRLLSPSGLSFGKRSGAE